MAMQTGGLYWEVPAGRRDGRVSRASETVDIPAPTFNLAQATQSFVKKGLTQDEMVALLGKTCHFLEPKKAKKCNISHLSF